MNQLDSYPIAIYEVQNMYHVRALYDQHNFVVILAVVLIGMPGIEKKLARYPQLYSRIGFTHEFDKLSKDETHHILEHKWEELGLSITIEDFSDYETITSVIKCTSIFQRYAIFYSLFEIDLIVFQ